MYKQFYSKLLLLVAMIVAGAGTALADPVTGTITFGTSNVKINASRVEDAADDLDNEWTIVTLGTTSFTPNSAYCQVGSAKAPATTITFQLTLPQELNITSMSAKFGGFNGTAGNVSLKVGSDVSNVTEIGTGSLNGTNDVVVTSTSQKAGQYLEVEVTDIDKGVKCYYISYTYELNGTEKTAIATIGDLTPTALNINDEGVFQLPITFATNDASDYEVTWTSNNTDVLDVDNNGNYLAYSAGNATVTVSVEPVDDETYYAVSKDFPVTVIDPNGPGMSKENPYTVAQARAAIDAGTGVTGVYAKGIVSKIVTPFNETFGNISYNISEDGTEEADQLEAYRGFSYNGEWFTSADDIQVGDEVVIYGNLKKYNSTYEFDANNQLVSLVRPQASQDPAINAEDVELAYDATSGEIAFTIDNPVEGYNVTVATPDVDWISDVAVSADANVITFTTTVNEGTEAREGHITINYGGTTVEARKVVKVTQGINENIQPVAVDGSYVKVTSTDDITNGQYLIVYEGNDTHDAAAFNGGLETLDAANNTIAITIENDEIAATDATKAAEFTIDVTAGTIKSASGLYIGKTANSNGLDAKADTQYTNTFAITNDEAVITASGNCTLRYNYASDQLRFRYYKTGQQAIQLYKYVANTPEEPEVKYYLAGSWDGDASWSVDGMLEMTKSEDGTYTISKEFADADTRFKIYKKDVDESETWYGGATTDGYYRIHRDWCTNVELSDTGNDFIINEAGNYTFTVDVKNLKLNVSGFPAQEFFLAGDFNNWATDANQFEYDETEGVYTLTQNLEANEQFKVFSEGKYYSTNTALTDGVALNISENTNNMWVDNAGAYTFKLEKKDNGNSLMLTVTFPQSVVKYYLAGSWENGWNADGMVELTEQEDGAFTATKAFDANTEFKFIKDVDGAQTWFGGNTAPTGDAFYFVHKGWCTNIPLSNDTEVEGGYKNFKIEAAGEYTFTLKTTDSGLAFDVTGWTISTEGNMFVKVATNDEFEDGAYLIVYEDGNLAFNGGLETLDGAKNTIDVDIINGTIKATDETKAALFIIQGNTIKSASGYYIGVTSYSNGLKQSENANAYSNNVSIDEDGNASIVINTADGDMTLRFNKGSKDMRFRYYKSGQEAIQLYKLVENFVPTVTIGEAQWATYVAVDNVEFPEGVTAYIPVQVNEGQTAVMIQSVSAVKKGEPVILNGEAGTYELSIADAETELADLDNMFIVADGTDVSDGTFYMLSYKNEKVGFRKVQEGVTIPAGKPYIEIVNAAKEFIPFGGGEATGIESFETVGFDVNAPIYDMQGRQVQKLQKGIFIQNGKKLIVK